MPGVWFAARQARGDMDLFDRLCAHLVDARPTAVNLEWAVRRVSAVAKATSMDLDAIRREADRIVEEDIEMNHRIGEIGSRIVPPGATILTHCNTGALATCGWGTALGVIKTAYGQGKVAHVYADETRPRLQGARLTAWELVKAGIPATLIPDSAAATLIRDGRIDCVILGADGSEVTHIGDVRVAPEGIGVYNPSFDVTPHENITGIITECGILREPYDVAIADLRKRLGR